MFIVYYIIYLFFLNPLYYLEIWYSSNDAQTSFIYSYSIKSSPFTSRHFTTSICVIRKCFSRYLLISLVFAFVLCGRSLFYIHGDIWMQINKSIFNSILEWKKKTRIGHSLFLYYLSFIQPIQRDYIAIKVLSYLLSVKD